jgi:cation transporter-like permease
MAFLIMSLCGMIAGIVLGGYRKQLENYFVLKAKIAVTAGLKQKLVFQDSSVFTNKHQRRPIGRL